MKKGVLSLLMLLMFVSLVGCGKSSSVAIKKDVPVKKISEKLNKKSVVQDGDTISVKYVGMKDDGTIFDTNIVEKAKESNIYNSQNPYKTLDFTVGAGQMIPGFDKGVIGMRIGETKKITMSPNDGYGERRNEMIISLDKEKLENDNAPRTGWKLGKKYQFQSPTGPVRGTLIEKNDKGIKIDLNHELAGENLVFEVTLVSIK